MSDRTTGAVSTISVVDAMSAVIRERANRDGEWLGSDLADSIAIAVMNALPTLGHALVPAALLEALDEFLDASERHREATSGELRVIEAGIQLGRKRKAYWALLDARKALPS